MNGNRIDDVMERQRTGLRWQLGIAATLLTGFLALLFA